MGHVAYNPSNYYGSAGDRTKTSVNHEINSKPALVSADLARGRFVTFDGTNLAYATGASKAIAGVTTSQISTNRNKVSATQQNIEYFEADSGSFVLIETTLSEGAGKGARIAAGADGKAVVATEPGHFFGTAEQAAFSTTDNFGQTIVVIEVKLDSGYIGA